MIATLVIKTQYGRMTQSGINLLSELDGEENKVFAHSVQDAIEWAKKFPLFQNAIIDNFADGRFVISSQWMPYDNSMAALFVNSNEWLGVELEEVKANPFKALLMSRKFWVMVLDMVVSITTYFITKYASPDAANDVLFLIGSLQPVILMVIGSIAYEDGENAKAEAVMNGNEALKG